MNPSTYDSSRREFQIAAAVKTDQKQQFWRYINSVAAGRRFPSSERVDAIPTPPGTLLRATDRDYEVQADGSWRRRDRWPGHCTELARGHSQIFVPHWPSKNKYPKAAHVSV